jgi:hypothetical protein|mmetsp:Transcript_10141/g.16236  ORF Transcript_10141/g.16236 Transcript_10141/m.16236 type:complete len:202 (+) Transcript_10141:687-1292(+)
MIESRGSVSVYLFQSFTNTKSLFINLRSLTATATGSGVIHLCGARACDSRKCVCLSSLTLTRIVVVSSGAASVDAARRPGSRGGHATRNTQTRPCGVNPTQPPFLIILFGCLVGLVLVPVLCRCLIVVPPLRRVAPLPQALHLSLPPLRAHALERHVGQHRRCKCPPSRSAGASDRETHATKSIAVLAQAPAPALVVSSAS